MNDIDKKPDYKGIYQYVCAGFNKTRLFYHGPFDETFYTLRVYESAKDIMKHVKCGKQEVLVACLLHDIGKTKLKHSLIIHKGQKREDSHKEWHKHARLGVPIARRFLKKAGHSEDFIDKVCYLIENHDTRDGTKKPVELQVVQDADLIADIGFAGFIRPFLYGTKFKRGVVGTINYIQTAAKRTEEQQLNLKISKIISEDKIKLEERLAKQIAKDTKTDLL
ncbi:HD domain-containing protein [Thermoproteota archaeon]